MRKSILTLIITAALLAIVARSFQRAFGSEKRNERYYQERWCHANGGIMEIRLSDGTRADCVTSEYAVEFDFARKWAEGLGQALRYARLTGKKAAVVLIWKNDADRIKISNLKSDIKYYGIPVDVFSIRKDD